MSNYALTAEAKAILREVHAAILLIRDGKFVSPDTSDEAWKHEHVTLGMPTWIYKIDITGICPTYNVNVCSTASCAMNHVCIVCHSNAHWLFEETRTDTGKMFTCPVVRSMSAAGLDVLEDEAPMIT